MNRELVASTIRLMKVHGSDGEARFTADEMPAYLVGDYDPDDRSTTTMFHAAIGVHPVTVEIGEYNDGWLISLRRESRLLWTGNLEKTLELAIDCIRWSQVRANLGVD